MNSGVLDVVIAGAGPAGMSAALWADELGLSYRLLETRSEPGGQLLQTFNKIDNHLGFVAQNGKEMRDHFLYQLNNRLITPYTSTSVSEIDITNMSARIDEDSFVLFKVFLICTGVRRNRLQIPGENEFQGKGILYSGKRDGELAAGTRAVVIGGGDAAFENALILAEFAKDVVLVHRRSEFSAREEFVAAVLNHPAIQILTDTKIAAIEGTGKVERLRVKQAGKSESVLEAGTVVIRIGVAPNNELVKDLVDLDDKGYVRVDPQGRTSRDHVYAAGDIANPGSPTISSAVGMGATSIKSIHADLASI